MWHLLVNLYQICSYDAPGVKNGPAPRGHKFKHRKKEGKTSRFLFSDIGRHRALIFGMQHLQVCSSITPGVITGPAPVVTSSLKLEGV